MLPTFCTACFYINDHFRLCCVNVSSRDVCVESGEQAVSEDTTLKLLCNITGGGGTEDKVDHLYQGINYVCCVAMPFATTAFICHLQSKRSGSPSTNFCNPFRPPPLFGKGLKGSIEKQSLSLGRDAVWNRTQRISKLPRVITVQFMRFYWKATPDSRDHAGVKCKMMRVRLCWLQYSSNWL